jgi:hypothetical protein
MFDIRTSFHIVGIVPMSCEDMKTIIFSILEQIQQVLVEAIKSHLISLSMTPLVQPLEEEYDQKFFSHHTYNSSIPKGK